MISSDTRPPCFEISSAFHPERRSKIAFAPRMVPGEVTAMREMPRNHLRLRSLSGTRRAEKHNSSFHLASVKKNCHATDHQNGDADVKPHQSSLLRRLSPIVAPNDQTARPRIRPLRRNPS